MTKKRVPADYDADDAGASRKKSKPEAEEVTATRTSSRIKTRVADAAAAAAAEKEERSSSPEPEEGDDAPAKKKVPPARKGRGAAAKKAAAADAEDDASSDEDDVAPKTRKAAPAKKAPARKAAAAAPKPAAEAARKSTRAKKKPARAEESSSDEEDQAPPTPEPRPKPKAHGGQKKAPAAAAAASAAGPSSKAAPPPASDGPRVDRAGKPEPWLDDAPVKVQERIDRALPSAKNRMFLMEVEGPQPGGAAGPKQQFKVLGASASVYTVEIKQHSSCTCIDHRTSRQATGGLCKHILFVLMRVLKVAPTDPLIWQRALTKSEVERLLSPNAAAGVDTATMAPEQVRQLFLRATGREQRAAPPAAAASTSTALEPGRRPIEGDCPICFEELEAGGREAFVWCACCGNNFHDGCFAKWASQKSYGTVTCVLCRQPWKTQSGGGAGSSRQGANVASPRHGRTNINLASYAEEQHGHGASNPMDLLYAP